jgi:UvrD-like helicase family protein
MLDLHGGLAAPPQLVIAGAGSGKINTLAHQAAHLIVQTLPDPVDEVLPKSIDDRNSLDFDQPFRRR